MDDEVRLAIPMTGAEVALIAMALTSYLDLARVVNWMTSGLEEDEQRAIKHLYRLKEIRDAQPENVTAWDDLARETREGFRVIRDEYTNYMEGAE